jgi:chitin synthase
LFLPIVSFGVAMNVIVVITLIMWRAFRLVRPEIRLDEPEKPEPLILVVPCYNETEDELRKSLDSLVTQKYIDNHPIGIIIVCDGRVRGPDMSETTADCLLNTVLTEKTFCEVIPKAYMGWDKHDVDITLQKGTYKGVPYMCVIKMQNSGKRDSLILVRSFCKTFHPVLLPFLTITVYNFNLRNMRPATIFTPRLFGEMAYFLLDDCKMHNVFGLVGLDADTVLDSRCVYELLKESRLVVHKACLPQRESNNNILDTPKLLESAE